MTTAREIMDTAELSFELPNLGWTVKVRKVGNLDIIFHGAKGLVTFLSDDEENGNKGKTPEERKKIAQAKLDAMTKEEKQKLAAEEYEASRQVVMAGLIEPKAVDRPWDEIDRDEEIHISLLDDDMNYAALRIMEHSGMIKEMPDLPFFRRTVAADSARDRGELRNPTKRTRKVAAKGIDIQRASVSKGKCRKSKKR